MKVRDVMSRTPLTLDPDDNVGIAAETMAWAHLRHLPVVSRRRVVGMVSEHDVLASLTELGDMRGSRRPVREIMTSPAHAIGPLADAGDAAAQMATKAIHCLPVVEDGRLVGVVTATDLLAHHAFEAAPPEPSRPQPPSGAFGGMIVGDIARTSPEVEMVIFMVEGKDIRHPGRLAS